MGASQNPLFDPVQVGRDRPALFGDGGRCEPHLAEPLHVVGSFPLVEPPRPNACGPAVGSERAWRRHKHDPDGVSPIRRRTVCEGGGHGRADAFGGARGRGRVALEDSAHGTPGLGRSLNGYLNGYLNGSFSERRDRRRSVIRGAQGAAEERIPRADRPTVPHTGSVPRGPVAVAATGHTLRDQDIGR